MRRQALRLLIAFLTFACGVAANMTWLTLSRAASAAHAPGRLANVKDAPVALAAPPCFALSANDAGCTHAYFPPERYGLRYERTEREVPSYQLRDYAGLLALMNEPSLLAFNDCEGEAYRFLWPRRLAAPLAIRVWRVGDRQFLAVKQLGVERACWVEGLTLDGSVQETVRPLSTAEWTRFVVLLNEAAYWSQPPNEGLAAPSSIYSLMAADRVLEGVKDCRYYMVERSAPGGDIRLACRYLLKLSDLGIPTDSFNLDETRFTLPLSAASSEAEAH
ncbi:MAG TPA: hypothetical protein VF525_02330 [Pyrinomonadaceae bacterium]|jgi:hypothetical protein